MFFPQDSCCEGIEDPRRVRSLTQLYGYNQGTRASLVPPRDCFASRGSATPADRQEGLARASMDYIWTPWRYHYIKDDNRNSSCVFCDIAASKDDENNLVVLRARSNYIVLNRFPYTSGHAMVIPYKHVAALEEAPQKVLEEMMDLTKRLEGVLRKLYRPSGINIGMNIGEAAGAGVAGHIHMHVLPRWVADSNFMAVVGETRVLPEDLGMTWQRMRTGFGTTDKHG